jgi:hypothetical protein
VGAGDSDGDGFGMDDAEGQDTSSHFGRRQARKIKGIQGDDLGRGHFEGQNIKDFCILVHLPLEENPIRPP